MSTHEELSMKNISSKAWWPLPITIRGWCVDFYACMCNCVCVYICVCVCLYNKLWWIVLSCLSRGSAPVLSLQTIACCISHRASLLQRTAHLHPPFYPPPPLSALRNLRSLCVTSPYPCSSPRRWGLCTRFSSLFPLRARARGSSVTFGCIAWVFHCARPTAFPLTSPWTGPNVYEPWPATPTPHPHYTFLHIHMGPRCFQRWRPPLFYLWALKWLQANVKCRILCCRCGMYNVN